MKLTTMTQVTVDGVMQGNGGASDEDRRNGFERGGWAMGAGDSDTMTFVSQRYQRADAFLFGRRTYELFAGYWGAEERARAAAEDPGNHQIAAALNTKPKHLASNTLTAPALRRLKHVNSCRTRRTTGSSRMRPTWIRTARPSRVKGGHRARRRGSDKGRPRYERCGRSRLPFAGPLRPSTGCAPVALECATPLTGLERGERGGRRATFRGGSNPHREPQTPCGAAGVGFEPTRHLSAPNGFQDRPFRPLRHPARGNSMPWAPSRTCATGDGRSQVETADGQRPREVLR